MATDCQDWRGRAELPTAQEILGEQCQDQLPANRIDEPWPSKKEYLQAQYEILRYEGVEGLRFSVRAYINSIKRGQLMLDDEFTCIYTEVRIKSYLLSRMGPIFRVSFSTQRSQFNIMWLQSRRLTPGTLVAISTKADQFKTICMIATVAQRPYRGGLDQKPPLIDLMWANPAEDALFDPSQELVMIESRNSYFEATRHALVGLQRAANIKSPLDKYLLGSATQDVAPGFVAESPIMDLSSLAHRRLPEQVAKIRDLCHYNITDRGAPNHKSLKNITTLDNSQLQGIHQIISTELAIVQGPPGTGKTFTSIEAIKVLISNRRSAQGPEQPPLLVAAQTNHALDQLLTLCMGSGANILRVGGRTEDEKIAERTAFNLRMNSRMRSSAERERRQLVASLEHNKQDIQNLVSSTFGPNLMNPDNLRRHGIISEEQYASLAKSPFDATVDSESMRLWLGDNLIPAELLREQHVERAQMDESEAIRLPFEYEYEYNEDMDNIVDEDDMEYLISGDPVPLLHQWTGKSPPGMKNWNRVVQRELNGHDDMFDIDPHLRGGVYQLLQSKMLAVLTPIFRDLLAKNIAICAKIKANRWVRDKELVAFEEIDIVGCTTTGLAKYYGFLAALQPKTLLIEEAAETREANITSALYPSIQQLVLVGDHQQLAPSNNIKVLAQAPFWINVSLFERMVKLGVGYVTLDQQRRMVPELRYVLGPFYPTMKDHPLVVDVNHRPKIPGMGDRRLWFFDHSWPEETDSNNSKVNPEEAQMIAGFFRYLVLSGTDVSKITVLTFYTGQRKRILSLLKRYLPNMQFKVCTVDSYQGEENDVVLLSLVRSPHPDRGYAVGFLEDERRAIVAISRARRGFYMFGNVDNMLKAHQASFMLWGKIWNGFAEQRAVRRSKGLPLVCRNHQTETWVKEVDDWGDNAGGCHQPCLQMRDCGHKCMIKCHTMEHKKLPCGQPCTKKLSCGHGCENMCGEVCHCRCDNFAKNKISEDVPVAQHDDPLPIEDVMAAANGWDGILRRERQRRAPANDQTADSQTASPSPSQSLAVRPGSAPGTMRQTHEPSPDRFADYSPVVEPGPSNRGNFRFRRPPQRRGGNRGARQTRNGRFGQQPAWFKNGGHVRRSRTDSDLIGLEAERTQNELRTAEKWHSFANDADSHDRAILEEQLRHAAKLLLANPGGINGQIAASRIKDTYKPTTLVDEQRASAGPKVVSDLRISESDPVQNHSPEVSTSEPFNDVDLALSQAIAAGNLGFLASPVAPGREHVNKVEEQPIRGDKNVLISLAPTEIGEHSEYVAQVEPKGYHITSPPSDQACPGYNPSSMLQVPTQAPTELDDSGEPVSPTNPPSLDLLDTADEQFTLLSLEPSSAGGDLLLELGTPHAVRGHGKPSSSSLNVDFRNRHNNFATSQAAMPESELGFENNELIDLTAAAPVLPRGCGREFSPALPFDSHPLAMGLRLIQVDGACDSDDQHDQEVQPNAVMEASAPIETWRGKDGGDGDLVESKPSDSEEWLIDL